MCKQPPLRVSYWGWGGKRKKEIGKGEERKGTVEGDYSLPCNITQYTGILHFIALLPYCASQMLRVLPNEGKNLYQKTRITAHSLHYSNCFIAVVWKRPCNIWGLPVTRLGGGWPQSRYSDSSVAPVRKKISSANRLERKVASNLSY